MLDIEWRAGHQVGCKECDGEWSGCINGEYYDLCDQDQCYGWCEYVGRCTCKTCHPERNKE